MFCALCSDSQFAVCLTVFLTWGTQEATNTSAKEEVTEELAPTDVAEVRRMKSKIQKSPCTMAVRMLVVDTNYCCWVRCCSATALRVCDCCSRQPAAPSTSWRPSRRWSPRRRRQPPPTRRR